MIGIIDSGIGGLSVVAELFKQELYVPFVYLGDVLHVPYGIKTKSQITKLTFRLINYLMTTYEIDTLIVACNTIVAACLLEIKKTYPQLKVISITKYGIQAVEQSLAVTVIATQFTVDQHLYATEIKTAYPKIIVQEIAAQSWVQMVENEIVSTSEISSIIETVFEITDTIILGCTHFPFLQTIIKPFLAANVKLIDPAVRCVQQLKKGLINDYKNTAPIYLTTGDIISFTKFIHTQNLYTAQTKIAHVTIN